ncbi:hypothetical protein [uncultured Nostoc sp.]|uniref:hypothetical protein n=1 Tax=uncultured Nostoc sp. TaxID=340711 RepID=UPI0035CAD060
MNSNHSKANFIKFNRIVSAGTATISLLFVGIGSPTLPAYAFPGECSTVNPEIARPTNVKTVRSVDLNGRIIQLRTGFLLDVSPTLQYGWARMANNQNGDHIWMDFSQDGGRTWKQCGPWTRQYSEAVTTSRDRNQVFRACGTVSINIFSRSEVKCTTWF